MDLDGVWGNAYKEGVFNKDEGVEGNKDMDIYIGRISASSFAYNVINGKNVYNLTKEEIKLNEYFRRNIAWRKGDSSEYPRYNKALVFINNEIGYDRVFSSYLKCL